MRVLIVGDSPFIATGFGRVNRIATEAFLAQGWEVAAIGGLENNPNRELDLPIKMFYPKQEGDLAGNWEIPAAIEEFKPDVVYMTGEPGMIAGYSMLLPARIPVFAYVPIEGEPIVNRRWLGTLKVINFMTCSAYGADVVNRGLRIEVPWVYHGVDRERFAPLTPERREEVRRSLDWSDKFVVTCVAQNVRRKQWPRLLEAVAILKHQYKQNDIVLYAHTVPFQQYFLDGWNLPEIVEGFGITDNVVFNPFLRNRNDSIPDRGEGAVLGMADIVGAADLFVLPSQVEGFGLPIAEAMSLGIPIVTTKYAAGWEVARGGLAVGVPPHDWEVHKSGTRYANIDPAELARDILKLKRDPNQRRRMRDAGLQRVLDFDWDAFRKAVVDGVVAAYEKGPPKVAGQEDAVEDESPEAAGPADQGLQEAS